MRPGRGILGDRACREAGDHLLRDPAALAAAGVVDGAELLIALSGKIDFPVGIAGLRPVCEPAGVLEVFDTVTEVARGSGGGIVLMGTWIKQCRGRHEYLRGGVSTPL